jgi:hypothetical protein
MAYGSSGAFTATRLQTLGPFTATTTAANVALSDATNGGQVRVANSGTTACRIAFVTSSTGLATTPTPGTLGSGIYTGGTLGSVLVLGGSVEVFGAPADTTYISFKTDSGTTTIEFSPGVGF